MGGTWKIINEEVSRYGLQRLFRRHGLSRRPCATQADTSHGPFQKSESGGLEMDVKVLPQLAEDAACRYLCVAMERATRRVLTPIKTSNLSTENARNALITPRVA